MSVFDVIFGKWVESTSNNIPVKDFTREAFDKIMSGVSVSNEAREKFYDAFFLARQEGPKTEEDAAITYLAGSGWTWNDFDRWNEVFSREKDWPYMWRRFKLHEEAPEYPKKISTALKFLTVVDMKNIIKKNEIKSRPAPKKRADHEEIIKARLSLKEIQAYVNEIVDFRRLAYKESREKAKCKLLIHTILMTISQWGRDDGVEDGVPIKYDAWDGGGCPIESEYAEKFNQGDLKGWPPFFPGDRTILVADIDE